MRYFILVVVLIALASCATTRNRENGGCGSENYKHRFRAKVIKIKPVDSGYVVTYRRMNNWYISFCPTAPDFKEGDYVCL